MWHLYVLFVFYSVWKLVENHLGNSILSNLILGNPGLKIDFALPERNVLYVPNNGDGVVGIKGRGAFSKREKAGAAMFFVKTNGYI